MRVKKPNPVAVNSPLKDEEAWTVENIQTSSVLPVLGLITLINHSNLIHSCQVWVSVPHSSTLLIDGFTHFTLGFWKATSASCSSPLLVLCNSKSGDNQGVKFLRKFKQLLNPAQVFDLMNGGPQLGYCGPFCIFQILAVEEWRSPGP